MKGVNFHKNFEDSDNSGNTPHSKYGEFQSSQVRNGNNIDIEQNFFSGK